MHIPKHSRDSGEYSVPTPRMKDAEHYKPDVIWEDGIALVREDTNLYRERLTGIILASNLKELREKNKTDYGLRRAMQKSKWRLIFPETGMEFEVPSRKDGIRIIWEFREALKNVTERYFVTTRGPDGRIRAYLNDPNPLYRYKRGIKPKRGHIPDSSPVFLACI